MFSVLETTALEINKKMRSQKQTEIKHCES